MRRPTIRVQRDRIGNDGGVVAAIKLAVPATADQQDVRGGDRRRIDRLVERNVNGCDGRGNGQSRGRVAVHSGRGIGDDAHGRRVIGEVDTVAVVVRVGVVIERPEVPSGHVFRRGQIKDVLVELVAGRRGVPAVTMLAKLFDKQRLPQHVSRVVDVLLNPVDGRTITDGPVVGPDVDCGEIDLGHLVVADEVGTDPAVVHPIAGVLVVEALLSRGEHVLWIDALHVRGHLLDPALERVAREVALDSRLVGQLPAEDRGVIPVRDAVVGVDAIQNGENVLTVPLARIRVRVEVVPLRGRFRAGTVVRIPGHILVHPAIVGPVVDQRQQDAQSEVVGLVNHVVESLEDGLVVHPGRGLQSAPTGPVREAPGTDDFQAHVGRVLEYLVHEPASVRIGRVGHQVVGVRTGCVEGAAKLDKARVFR